MACIETALTRQLCIGHQLAVVRAPDAVGLGAGGFALQRMQPGVFTVFRKIELAQAPQKIVYILS